MRAFWSARVFRATACLCLAVWATLSATGPARAEDIMLDGIVATVNGKIITRFELDERLRPVYEQLRGKTLSQAEYEQVRQLKRQILDQMIEDILIVQDAERYKLKVTDAEVEEQIKAFILKRNLTDAEFKKQLGLMRMTREDFSRNMKRDIIRSRVIGGVVSNKVVVTDAEVQQRYNERKSEFSKGSSIQLALIMLPPGMKAMDLKAAIEAGQMTFAQAADKYSQGPGAGQGGDIGNLNWKDLAPEWNEALQGLKPGQVSQPVHVQDFEALLQLVAVNEGEETPLEAVRDQIYQSLHEGKHEQVYQEYMKRQRAKAVIEYRNL